MADALKPGMTHTKRIAVDRDRTIGFMGENLRVYATPKMVSDMEYACRDWLVETLPEGQDSVGVRVEIDHLGPTLIGMDADIDLTVESVDGRRITFAFEVADKIETVGRGRHVRFIVDKSKTAERLAAKAKKAGLS